MSFGEQEGGIKMCGVAGVAKHPGAASIAWLMAFALQHRGQESFGVAIPASHGDDVHIHKDPGLVGETFSHDVAVKLGGTTAIGHNRYSTSGNSCRKNSQPIMGRTWRGKVALGHNGNLTNALALRKRLEADGQIFQTEVDSEVILHLLARSRQPDFLEALKEALGQVEGAYSLLVLFGGAIYAVCDPYQFRPLWLGQLDGSHVVASETCAFDLIGAKPVRELGPGEMLEIRERELRSEFLPPAPWLARCIFELVYFARPDSVIFGRSVYQTREVMGRILAQEQSVKADLVVPIPDSGTPAAWGFAKELGVECASQGLIRNHYVGRTFIQPGQDLRDLGIRLKLNPIRSLLQGKRVVLVDDSIVRALTSKRVVRLVKEAGATEVHMRISCPPTISPCFWGVDTPEKWELAVPRLGSVEAVREFIGADTLGYLSLPGLLRSVESGPREFCTSCFTGECPVNYRVEQLIQIQ